MNDLRGLIRLYKWRLDEKRRALAELQNLRDHLEQETERLEAEIVAEQEVARQSFEASLGYANYAQAANERRKRLAHSIAQVEIQIAAATEEMQAAYQELKRFELAQEERVRREREKIKRKENAMLDEIALTGFQRRQSGGGM